MDRHEAHAVAPLLEDRRLGGLSGGGLRLQRVDEPPERHAALHFVLTCELRDVQHVGERLLATGTEHEADMRAGMVEERGDGVRHRPPVPLLVQRRQQFQRLSNRAEPIRQRLRRSGTGGTVAPPW